MISIANQHLTASINFKGAELTSLKSNKDKTEYIWQADPVHWARHSPVLFPIVGKLRKDEYILNDLTYSMSQHGFARDLEFQVIRQEDSYAALALKSNAQTMMMYPFKFELIITYELIDKTLKVGYQVINKDHQTMYFSIGGHPAFNCPVKGGKRSDYLLKFEKAEKAETQLLEVGLRSGKTKPILENTDTLPITDELFDQDALIFENLQSSSLSLLKESKKFLTFHFDNFPYLGIWSKNSESPFVCIEPWYGIADTTDADHHLVTKEGINKLDPTESFQCEYQIEIH